MNIKLEGVEVPVSTFMRLLIDKEFYRFYYHKLILCRLNKHEYKPVNTKPVLKCSFCKQEIDGLAALQEVPKIVKSKITEAEQDAILKSIFVH